ncbi:FmdB family zinc ribbon protein [Geopsychrobacter electrodiphilus]|uniref:FmdB family zinc ribbon protein n=1 Tax=Geopsychrobacter electrodiphilus TaxID=225196 RepID=UPI0009FCC1D5|nr:zinc ribbon domain-containing protein [Geopsychrobacter electrodiphilus]
MPIYEYQCSGCDTRTEKISRTDVHEIDCPQCNGKARRIVSVVAAKANDSVPGAGCRPSSGFT